MKTREGYKCDMCDRLLPQLKENPHGLHFCNNHCRNRYAHEPVLTYIKRDVTDAVVSADWPPTI